MFAHAFWLLCAGTFVEGIYNAFGQYYRFAAADIASPNFRPRAISLTLAGGIAGASIGPRSAFVVAVMAAALNHLALPFICSTASATLALRLKTRRP